MRNEEVSSLINKARHFEPRLPDLHQMHDMRGEKSPAITYKIIESNKRLMSFDMIFG